MADNFVIWYGLAGAYDTYRPQPPTVLLDIFTQFIDTAHPHRVVDIGSGTGLSTVVWGERAQSVIGIEPNDEMRQQAVQRTTELGVTNVVYQAGLSTQTDLPAGCADIVTCSQALHWMEPEATFAEIARILRPGGVFAVYDYSWPPTVRWEADFAYEGFMERVEKVSIERGLKEYEQYWPKEDHLARMKASGHFRFLKEVLVHHTEMGNAERFIGLILSSSVAHVLQQGVSPDDIGLASFKSAIQRSIGDEPLPWYFSYRVRIGIK